MLDEQTLGPEPAPEAPQDLPAELVRAPAGEQTYVVQTRGDRSDEGWLDVATVTVPPRTRRRTVIEKALEQAPDARPTTAGDVLVFRALDADSAEEIPVALVPPEPTEPVLRIG